MKKTLLSLAMAASLGLVSASASAVGLYNEFTVDESTVPGTPGSTFVADYINGFYNEKLVIAGDSTFTTSAYAIFNAFADTDGTSPVSPDSYLNSAGGDGYSMYAIFTSSGLFTGSGFTGNVGTFDLYIDPNKNSNLGFSGTTATALGTTTDDYRIAFATNLTLAAGLIGGATTSGSFDLYFDDFSLTTGDLSGATGTQNGDLFFTQPRPFHLLVNVDGDFNQFTFSPGGTFDVNGDVSAVFVSSVPEPATLALMGLGLVGMGLGLRRRKV